MDRFGRHLRQPAPAPEMAAPVVEPTPIEAEQPYIATESNPVAAEPIAAEQSRGFASSIKERVSGTYASLKERHNMAIRRVKIVGATALAAAAVGYGIEAFAGGGSDGPVRANADPVAASFKYNQPNCKDFAYNDISSNPNQFTAKAFLPKIEGKSAQTYVDSLFSKNGALTNDAHSLASVMAAIVEPSLKTSINDPNYSYIQTYKEKIAAYQAEGGQKVAARDCETAYDVMTQIGSDTDNWTGPGDRVSYVAASRSHKYRIDGMLLSKPQIVQRNLSGIEFVLNNTAKGLNGQELQSGASVLVQPDGTMVIKGLKPTQAGTSMQQTGHKQHQKHHKNQHNHHMNHKGTEQGQVSTGSAGGSVGITETQASTGTSTTTVPGTTEGQGGTPSNGTFGTSHNSGESNVPGPVKETGPGSTAGNGGPTGHAPGNAPSFGGGGPGPSGETPSAPAPSAPPVETTPPTTTPPAETPPTTPPPTTPPPTETPPTTPPPTTPPPTTTPPTTPPPTTPPVKGPAPEAPGL